MSETSTSTNSAGRVLGFYLPIVSSALLGVILGATNVAGSFSSQLFLASLIVLGVALIFVSFSLLQNGVRQEGTYNAAKLDAILEAMQMSENAKRVLFRDRELELLRKTVQDDIEAGDFHAALVLCDQMANVFGAVEEAEKMRTRVQEIIHQHHEERIREEMKQLTTLLEAHQWVEAYQYASKMRRLYPESPLLHDLEQRIASVRTEYGHQLEERFLMAAEQDDVENAMAFLKELDGYLTPDEARRIRSTADKVIATYRENISAKFKMAVRDHRWREALAFGEEIMNQFPNAQMASEVREIMNTIQARAVEDETAS